MILAAGGVVWRAAKVQGSGVEVLVVHRPRYDDWTIPKGKLDAGEAEDVCALREVLEETGYTCVLGDELPPVEYLERKKHLPKRVRYWLMQAVGEPVPPTDGEEVDQILWIAIDEAVRVVSYDRDIDTVRAAAKRLAELGILTHP